MKIYEGRLSAEGLKLGVVLSKFNSFISERLLEGAKDAFYQLNGKDEDMEVFKVPGAYEIPGMVKRMLNSGRFDAIVCLGVIIQGDTPHFEYVAGNSAKAIMELSLQSNIPVIYGLLTVSDIEQAIDRAGAKMGNKGYYAVMAAIETANLYREIK